MSSIDSVKCDAFSIVSTESLKYELLLTNCKWWLADTLNDVFNKRIRLFGGKRKAKICLINNQAMHTQQIFCKYIIQYFRNTS